MATISHYEFTGLYPIGTTYLTSGDGYLHVYNYGPLDLIANMVSVTEPAAPSTGMRLRANEWTLVPADTEDAETRIAFVQLVDDSVFKRHRAVCLDDVTQASRPAGDSEAWSRCRSSGSRPV